MSISADLTSLFSSVGARGFLHACAVDGEGSVDLDADELVVTASVFKVPVLLELAHQAAAGEIDLTSRVVVPSSQRTLGPTGLSVMLDDVEVSVRDLAFMMMSVSDNTATDVLMEMIGVSRIADTLMSLGLHETVVQDDCAAILGGFHDDLGLGSEAIDSMDDLDPALVAKTRAVTASATNRTTPREMTRLLSLIWRDEAGPPEACTEVRRIMALQVWPHRLTSGFPASVLVAGKTGTLPGIRNEAGVVTYPDGTSYAVAVFTQAHAYDWRQPAIDAAIGTAARMAIESLRG